MTHAEGKTTTAGKITARAQAIPRKKRRGLYGQIAWGLLGTLAAIVVIIVGATVFAYFYPEVSAKIVDALGTAKDIALGVTATGMAVGGVGAAIAKMNTQGDDE